MSTTVQSPRALGAVARYALLVGPLLSMVDSSIVNVAIPSIARDLKVTDLSGIQWVVSGYLLALGVSLAATAYLAKRFGVLGVYTVSMILFVAASAACAFAGDVGWLIGFRAAQGFVGAPLVPLAISILLGKDGLGGGKVPVSAALTLFLAPALGPTIGGLILSGNDDSHWRWIFLINVPIGIIGLLLMLRVPRHLGAQADASTRFDPIGFLLLGVGLTAALYGATEGTTEGWDTANCWVPLAGGLVLLVIYAGWALRRPHPAVNLNMIRHRNSAIALVLQVLCSVITFGTVFLLPIFTQTVQGHTALETGIALLPQGIIMGLGTWVGQKLTGRVPLKVMVITGFAILAISSVFLLFLEHDTPLWVTALILSGRAIAIGFVTTPLLVAMLAPLPENQLPDGNTLFNITQRLGGSIGVSILGSIVGAGGLTLDETVDRFHLVGGGLVVLAVLAGLLSLFLTRGDGTSERTGLLPE
ncbi:MAG TPA: DHA2 family efflux MFS transporter permease subunit [Galbitalea sp.]|jgi:EmrB/QacA subfamily drug resistance transporter|nr:DHA2 family efflux MFS transporter permease subunit [Galbitalea sp.]